MVTATTHGPIHSVSRAVGAATCQERWQECFLSVHQCLQQWKLAMYTGHQQQQQQQRQAPESPVSLARVSIRRDGLQ